MPLRTQLGQIQRPKGSFLLVFLLFTLLGVFISAEVALYHRSAHQLTEIASKELTAWRSIERIILMYESPNIEPGLINERISERQQRKVAMLLNKIKQQRGILAQELDKFQSHRISVILKARINLQDIQVNDLILSHIRAYVESDVLSPERELERWDPKSRSAFLDGSYLNPLLLLSNTAREQLRLSNQFFAILISVALVLIFVSIYLIYRKYIVKAFDNIEAYELELRRAIAASRVSNERLKTAFYSLRDAACLTDSRGRLMLMNEPFEQLFIGHVERTVSFQQIASIIPAYDTTFSAMKKRDMMAFVDELSKNRDFNYRARDLRWSFTNLVTGGWLVVIYDQTEFETKKTHALRAQRLELMRRLASSFSHDFNNILASIMNDAELVSLEKSTEAWLTERLDGIVDNCRRGQLLTSQLLTYAKQQPMMPTQHQVNSLVERAIARVAVPSTIDIKADLSIVNTISVDKVYFELAVKNLIQNSVEAISGEPGVIKVTTYEDISSRGERVIAIEIADTGPGFSLDAMKMGTDPFYSTKRKKNCTGMGLAMVEGFVSQSNGTFTISNSDQGAVCSMAFPVVDTFAQHALPSLPAIDRSDAKTQSQTCLLLEDDDRLVALLEKFLSRFFERVIVATTQSSAIEILDKSDNLDAALCDWKLPDGTSEAVVRRLCNRFPEAKVVIHSGLIEDQVIELIKEFNLDVLNKPVSLKEIADILGLHYGHQVQAKVG